MFLIFCSAFHINFCNAFGPLVSRQTCRLASFLFIFSCSILLVIFLDGLLGMNMNSHCHNQKWRRQRSGAWKGCGRLLTLSPAQTRRPRRLRPRYACPPPVNRPSTVRPPPVHRPSTARPPPAYRPSTVRPPPVHRPSTGHRSSPRRPDSALFTAQHRVWFLLTSLDVCLVICLATLCT